MGNEAYTEMKCLFKKCITVLQLAPPRSHRSNAIERAICTFNDHFVAGLASVDNNFLTYLWFHMVKQAEITIDLLKNLEQIQVYLSMHKCSENLISAQLLRHHQEK